MSRYTRWLTVAMATTALLVSIGNVLFVQRLTCTVVRSNVAVYEETPPTLPSGKNAQAMWLRLEQSLYC